MLEYFQRVADPVGLPPTGIHDDLRSPWQERPVASANLLSGWDHATFIVDLPIQGRLGAEVGDKLGIRMELGFKICGG